MDRKQQEKNSNPAGHQQHGGGAQSGVEGEGSYSGTKDYNARTQRFAGLVISVPLDKSKK